MSIFDVVFPKNCLECGEGGNYICGKCLKRVSLVKPICPECGRPSVDGMTHFKCKHPLGLDGLTCLWEYQGVVRKAILALKYKFAHEIADELSKAFVLQLNSHPTSYILLPTSVLVPIPLHWFRENFRGFNQSEEIGKRLVEKMGWKFISDLLVRKKVTTPQTELKRGERLGNVRGIFSLNTDHSQLITNYPQLVLFDDVYTTGATLKEACKVLKRAGAASVWGLTLAR